MKRQLQYRECLTNEMLLKHFKSQFDLVRFAIQAATDRIHAGHAAHNPEDDNIVTEILEDIAEGRMGDYSESDSYEGECELELDEIEEVVEEKPKSRKKAKV